MSTAIDVRFWSKVDRRGPDECWLWTASVGTNGYGAFSVGGSQKVASRLSLEMALGRQLSRTELACHRCDVPTCVNPAHLFVGSQRDNVRDASAKGRMATGARNIRSREPHRGLARRTVGPLLTRVIQGRHARGETGADIARKYHLNPATVSRIVNGSRHKKEVAA